LDQLLEMGVLEPEVRQQKHVDVSLVFESRLVGEALPPEDLPPHWRCPGGRRRPCTPPPFPAAAGGPAGSSCRCRARRPPPRCADGCPSARLAPTLNPPCLQAP
jgi:hypothetical protein